MSFSCSIHENGKLEVGEMENGKAFPPKTPTHEKCRLPDTDNDN